MTFAIYSRTESCESKSEEQFSELFTYAQSHNRDTLLVEEKKKNGENGNGKRKGRSEIRFAARGKGREGEAHEIQLNMAMD